MIPKTACLKILGAGLTGFLLVAVQASDQAWGNSPVSEQSVKPDTLGWPARFGLGRPATAKEIAVVDIDVWPDGTGLPAGSGTVSAGKALYTAQCTVCHGATGTESATLGGRLVATSLTGREKAIGNYWPYATTLFDYIRRAMPLTAPGSLSNDEVYSLTAFLLQANQIIDSTVVINAKTLPKVVMPAQKFFVPDDRKGGREIR
ncbi:c-type cytochrome [Larkinella humicola]|uniref:Cytochrome c n=1 Tax=Larkinella humicola TaxID=2607654 RepID=A0A5N1JIY8_9BACT|nr:cytochrome c [Larkinella humicola]KAA9353102.1 cytochrome c [Larkinella humicola]